MQKKIVFCIAVSLITLLGCSTTPKLPPMSMLMASHISGSVVYARIVSHEPFLTQIFLKNLDTGEIRPLTAPGKYGWPRWSPDGRQILFLSWTKENSHDIYLMNKDGSNQRPVVAGPADETMADWSPDGGKIVFVSNDQDSDSIYVLDLKAQTILKLIDNVGVAGLPKWSPDGKRIAFISAIQHSRPQVFVMNADGTDIEQLTEYDLDHFDDNPAWCPDDSCIVFTRYVNGIPKLMLLDLSNKEVHQLFSNVFAPDLIETRPVRSPSRSYITFSVGGVFYAMDMKKGEIYPLGVEALDLSLYP